jgi:hypothetical protein
MAGDARGGDDILGHFALPVRVSRTTAGELIGFTTRSGFRGAAFAHLETAPGSRENRPNRSNLAGFRRPFS